MTQTTNTVFLVAPASFGFNTDTAKSNAFQNTLLESASTIQQKALEEFNGFVNRLRESGIVVHAFEDTAVPVKPDALFPNNWISLHADGKAILYPMCAPNRRHESRTTILRSLQEKYAIHEIIDLRPYEEEGLFLEGTGSVIFDHEHQLAYACLSERTNKQVLTELCDLLGYTPIVFNATDQNGLPIYHTNVMLCVGTEFVIVCLESITDPTEKAMVIETIMKTDKTLVDISFEQLNNFAGNMLELKDDLGNAIIVLSASANNSLTTNQRAMLNASGKLLPVNINTIETVGGGSARCMIAEVFLKPR